MLRLPPVRSVFHRQIYFSGVQAIGAVSMIAVIAGVVITTQITSLVGTANPGVTARILLWTLVMAGSVLATLPILILFLFFQRYFIRAFTLTGVKG